MNQQTEIFNTAAEYIGGADTEAEAAERRADAEFACNLLANDCPMPIEKSEVKA
jgi:hypothetical protein